MWFAIHILHVDLMLKKLLLFGPVGNWRLTSNKKLSNAQTLQGVRNLEYFASRSLIDLE